MLIYDHNKQFLGIDDDDLKNLGYSSAGALLQECSDFADLFVKRPGYIHNFKNFEWIDFVLHAEAEDSKAIIHTSKSNFTCKLVVKPFHLLDNADENAFMIVLQNLKPLSDEESSKVAHDIEMHPSPSVSKPVIDDPLTPHVPLPDVSLPNFDELPSTELREPDIFDVPQEIEPFAPQERAPVIDEDTFKLDVDDIYSDVPKVIPDTIEPDLFAQEPEETSLLKEESSKEATFDDTPKRSNLPDIPMLGDQLSKQDHEYLDNLNTDRDYVYDPAIAANELGLPVDLIEEFIGDFIQQSHDFHDELFEKVEEQDRESVQTLSHKLKGVAANLRIEDAFEVLAIINTSHDFDEIKANLKYYYHIIAKLEGDESAQLNFDMPLQEPAQPSPLIQDKEDDDPLSDLVEDEEPIKSEDSDESIYTFDLPDDDFKPDRDDISDLVEPEENKSVQDDDIYDFDIPKKPPVFDDEDDDEIYSFVSIDKSVQDMGIDKDDEIDQESAIRELLKDDDEPILFKEPEIEKEEEPLIEIPEVAEAEPEPEPDPEPSPEPAAGRAPTRSPSGCL
jgi:HPt (histidine-containing phosphotransfer) domain-containing protein